jgi:hypothetical protein
MLNGVRFSGGTIAVPSLLSLSPGGEREQVGGRSQYTETKRGSRRGTLRR